MRKFDRKVAFDSQINQSILESSVNKAANDDNDNWYIAQLLKKANDFPDKPVFVQEYLLQLGKRIQMYWGTAHPKKFIRTFSEVEQLLKSTKKDKQAVGLAISIIDEDALQKVRLVINPDFGAVDHPTDNHLLKTFYLSRSVLESLVSHWKGCGFTPTTLDIHQPIGIEFCIGKQTPDQELYDYYIIVQVVDLCHNRIIDMNYLPVSIPNLSDFQLFIP